METLNKVSLELHHVNPGWEEAFLVLALTNSHRLSDLGIDLTLSCLRMIHCSDGDILSTFEGGVHTHLAWPSGPAKTPELGLTVGLGLGLVAIEAESMDITMAEVLSLLPEGYLIVDPRSAELVRLKE